MSRILKAGKLTEARYAEYTKLQRFAAVADEEAQLRRNHVNIFRTEVLQAHNTFGSARDGSRWRDFELTILDDGHFVISENSQSED